MGQPAPAAGSRLRERAFPFVSMLYLALIWIAPIVVGLAPAYLLRGSFALAASVVSWPLALVAHVLVAAALGCIHARHVVAGSFPRSVALRPYFHRRLYGLSWTALFYSPAYPLALTLAPLRRAMLKLFGYRGSPDFVTYPDTWLRDLPLLDLGKGAYLSNKATIGTNLVLADGSILVGGIRVGEGALVGHLAMLAPKVTLGDRAQIGVGVAIGIGTRVGADAQIGPRATLEHHVVIAQGVRVGTCAYVGSRSHIGRGLVIPGGVVVPPGTRLESQDDVARLVSGAPNRPEVALQRA